MNRTGSLDGDYSDSTVISLAKAVMKPGSKARLLAENNEVTGESVSIEQAVRRSSAFMVDLRDGVVAWDADPDEGEAAMLEWVELIRAAAMQINARFVMVGSGRPGHHHVYIVSPPGWSSQDLLDLLVARGAPRRYQRATRPIRPPLSPHRSGGAGVPVEPTTVPELLSALRGRPGVLPLGDPALDLLHHGDRAGRHRRVDTVSRTTMAQALATHFINAGLGLDEYTRDMRDRRNRGGEKIQELERTRGLDVAIARCAQIYEDQRIFVREHPAWGHERRERRAAVALLRETVETYPWHPRTGTTDRLVYEYLVSVAAGIDNPQVAHSLRSIADGVHRTRPTVTACLRRLRAQGLITVVKPGTVTDATTYLLQPQLPRIDPHTPDSGGQGESKWVDPGHSPLTGPLHDAFRGALPRSAQRTLRAMPPEAAVTVAELKALMPGASARTVRRDLHELRRAGLVEAERERPTGQWRRLPDADDGLDQVAHRLGTAGSAERRRRATELEREARSRKTGIVRRRSTRASEINVDRGQDCLGSNPGNSRYMSLRDGQRGPGLLYSELDMTPSKFPGEGLVSGDGIAPSRHIASQATVSRRTSAAWRSDP
ncbi:hypothetical protein [Geodermatophilus sp. URMC 65]